MTFIQLIEITTTSRDEVDALVERWRSRTEGPPAFRNLDVDRVEKL